MNLTRIDIIFNLMSTSTAVIRVHIPFSEAWLQLATALFYLIIVY